MKKQNQETLSDLFKIGEAAFSTLLGAAQEVAATHKGKHNMLPSGEGQISKEEFDAAFAMIKKMRQSQLDLEKRIEQIESKLDMSSPQITPDEKQRLTDS